MNAASLRVIRPDGSVLEDKLQECLTQIESDIRACSNACDAYSKKTTLAKVVHGIVWNTRFAEYVNTFQQRRAELEFTLTVRTGVGVEQANVKYVAFLHCFHQP